MLPARSHHDHGPRCAAAAFFDGNDLDQFDRSVRRAAHRRECAFVTETPIELDRHRGMAAQKATDIRRVIADVEANAKLLRDKQGVVEIEILAAPATSWPEAVAKARYVLNLYSAGLPATDTHHRDLVAAVLADLTRLSEETT